MRLITYIFLFSISDTIDFLLVGLMRVIYPRFSEMQYKYRQVSPDFIHNKLHFYAVFRIAIIYFKLFILSNTETNAELFLRINPGTGH